MKYNYHCAGGRDLYCEPIYCKCPNPSFLNTDIAHLMKNKIHLSGYDDNYFFDEVNKEPRQGKCNCGRKFTYQWLHDCVEFQWEDEK